MTLARNQSTKPLTTRPLTHEEIDEFEKRFTELVTKYGADRIKARAKRPPTPRKRGRPKQWSESALFTLWLIAQTFLQEDCNVDNVCRLIAKNILLDNGKKLFYSGARPRRLFYEAEQQFEQYEAEYADVVKLARHGAPCLKERLFAYAESLFDYGILERDLSFAGYIVFYELVMDGVYRCRCNPSPPFDIAETARISGPRDVPKRTRKNSCLKPSSG
jgi:hypothetical protein